MTSIYKNKEGVESDRLYKLLSQTDTQTIEDNLFTKSTIQKRKKMKMKTEKEEKLLINNQKHLKEKQDPFLRFKDPPYYRNRCIGSYDKSNSFTERKINNVHVKNHESDRTKLRDLRKRNVNYYLDS